MSIFRRRVKPPKRAGFVPRQRQRYVPSPIGGIAPSAGTLTFVGHAPTITQTTNVPIGAGAADLVFVHVIQGSFTTFKASTAQVRLSSGSFIHDDIIDPGLVRQEAFGSGRTLGFVAGSYGDAVYCNVSRRAEQTLLGVPTDNAKLTCWVGPADGRYPADFDIEYIAYIDGTPRFNDKTMTIRLRDRSSLFDQKVSQLGFDHALSDSAGTRLRPFVYGANMIPAPILYHPFEVEGGNIWYCQKNEPIAIDDVFDGGVRLVNQGQAASVGDLSTGAAPDPSCYKWYYQGPSEIDPESEGLWLRLCSKVFSEVRYFANSETISISEFAAAAGITGSMADDSVDLSLGSRQIETQTYRDVLNDVARSNLSIIGLNRQDQLFQRYILPCTEPDYDTDFRFELGSNSTNWEVYAPGGMERRVKELQVNSGATTKGQIAGIPDLDPTAAEALSREKWLTSFIASSAWVAADDAGADRLTIDIEANNFAGDEAAMTEYANGVFALFGSRQIWYWVSAQYTPETAALNLMDKVSLLGDRLQTGGGVDGRIVSIERRLKSPASIRFGVWSHNEFDMADPDEVTISSIDDASVISGGSALTRGGPNVQRPDKVIIKCGNPDTPVNVIGFVNDIPSFPCSMRLSAVQASVSTAQTSGSAIEVDVRIDGVSVLSTLLTIPNGSTSSTEITYANGLMYFDILKGQSFQVYVTNYGDATGSGLAVTLMGMERE